MKNKVLLCGCGWLGLYLARSLSENTAIIGTTRTTEKAEYLATQGIQPLLFTLEESAADFTYSAQGATVILNIPPGRKRTFPEEFSRQMCDLIDCFAEAGAAHIIFVSTTAVYGEDISGSVNEDSPVAPHTSSGKAHVVIEQYLRSHPRANFSIVRLAGLVGPDRHPVRYLAGRQLAEGERVVNLVHIFDVVDALKKLIEHGANNETFHLCATEHPRRGDYYPAIARKLGLEEPEFGEMKAKEQGKRVDASRSWQKLGLSVQYASPYDMV